MEQTIRYIQDNLEHYVERINNLTPQTQALWGKMNVAQMMHHCQKSLHMADGRLQAKANPIIKFLFGKMAKKEMLTKPDIRKNLQTFKVMQIVDQKEFDKEKKALLEQLQEFKNKGALIEREHSLFGKLSAEEWNILLAKHLDHHLKQFGV